MQRPSDALLCKTHLAQQSSCKALPLALKCMFGLVMAIVGAILTKVCPPTVCRSTLVLVQDGMPHMLAQTSCHAHPGWRFCIHIHFSKPCCHVVVPLPDVQCTHCGVPAMPHSKLVYHMLAPRLACTTFPRVVLPGLAPELQQVCGQHVPCSPGLVLPHPPPALQHAVPPQARPCR